MSTVALLAEPQQDLRILLNNSAPGNYHQSISIDLQVDNSMLSEQSTG